MPQLNPKILAEIERKRKLYNNGVYAPPNFGFGGQPLFDERTGWQPGHSPNPHAEGLVNRPMTGVFRPDYRGANPNWRANYSLTSTAPTGTSKAVRDNNTDHLHNFFPNPDKKRIARTLRNNNPAALSDYGDKWDGMSAKQTDIQLENEDAPMVQYDNPLYGIRAAARNFRTKYRKGNKTIRKIIKSHLGSTKPKEQVDNLTSMVAKALGKSGSDEIDLEDDNVMQGFLQAIITHEGDHASWRALLDDPTANNNESGLVRTGIMMEHTDPTTATAPLWWMDMLEPQMQIAPALKLAPQKPDKAYNYSQIPPSYPDAPYGRSGGTIGKEDLARRVAYSQSLNKIV
jgi:hypothetical protein